MNEENGMFNNNNIRPLIEDLAAPGAPDAHELADAVIGLMVATLAHNPSIPSRTFSDWWAQLANARALIVEQIHRRVDGHVDVEDVLRTLEFEGVL
jgi:hypothetical protein